ncbi:MAG: DNA mismatch repair protein MutS, partial [Alphaproteobacteria bacterium]
MSEKSKLSPVMQQYVDMKSENPDALLLFRLGDFYEAFFDDAKTISNALGLVLTHRGSDADGEDIPMCGIPWHAADNYFGRLVREGFCVALVEQMETPEEAKKRGHKFIDRKIIRVLTPGTLTDENLLSPKNSNFLVAVLP